MCMYNSPEKRSTPWWKQVVVVAVGIYLACFSALILAFLMTGQEIPDGVFGSLTLIIKLLVALLA